MSLLNAGERFSQLEIIEEVAPDYYRCRCLRCKYDGALATARALILGTAKVCFDCTVHSKMSDSEKTLRAFRRSLQMLPEPLPIGWAA